MSDQNFEYELTQALVSSAHIVATALNNVAAAIREANPTGNTLAAKPAARQPARRLEKVFDETFWQHYPRKMNKDAAYRDWLEAVERVQVQRQCPESEAVEFIGEAAAAFGTSGLAKSRFCPGPTTWLKNGRWDDDRSTWVNTDNAGKRDYSLPYGNTDEEREKFVKEWEEWEQAEKTKKARAKE